MPSPRDLDPNFKDADVPANNDAVVETDNVKKADEPKGGMIVHKQRYVDGEGVHREKVHGPMPVGEWADYEREHNL